MTDPTPPTTMAPSSSTPGGFWIRFLASLLDSLILAIPSWILLFLLSLLGPRPGTMGPLAWIWGLLMWLLSMALETAYAIYFLRSSGATPGKKVFGLKVVNNSDLSLLTTRQIMLREFIGKPLSAFLFMIGFLMAGFRKDKRALHDLIADSKVLQLSP